MNKIAWRCTEKGARKDDMPIAAKNENALTLMSAMTMAVIAKKRVSAAKNCRFAIAVPIAPRPRSLTLTYGPILLQSFPCVEQLPRLAERRPGRSERQERVTSPKLGYRQRG